MEDGIKVELTEVTKSFNNRNVIRSVTTSVSGGECLAITGNNGSGKSTLLKIIAGLIRPTSGTARLLLSDRQLKKDELNQYISMVSPEMQLYGYLTACENIKLLAEAGGVRLNEETVLDSLHIVGLRQISRNAVQTFSTGMKQRVKLALVIALDRPLWLLDEPSANLDADGRKQIEIMIKTGLVRKKTIVLATNEAAEAEYATKTIALA